MKRQSWGFEQKTNGCTGWSKEGNYWKWRHQEEGHSDIQKEVMRTCRRWTAVGFSTASYLVAWLGVSCSFFFFLRFFWCGLFSFFSFNLICYNIASIFLNVSFWPWGMWDLTSATRDQTCTPCIGRRTLLYWIAREVPPCSSHHRSVLYRPAQAPMSAPSYMSLGQEMCLMLLCMQSPDRWASNKVFDLSC